MKTILKVCLVLGLVAVLASASSTENLEKNVQNLSKNKKAGLCPRPRTLLGSCTRDESVNCERDSSCSGKKKCCREGCNKVCKDPIKKLELELPKIDNKVINKWKDERVKEWNDWTEGTKSLMMERLGELQGLIFQ